MGRIALGVCFAAAAWAGTACAGTMTVTSLADDGDGGCDATCTVRDAVASAASGDQIVFSNSLTLPGTNTLAGQEILLYKTLSIVGPGADQLTISGGGASRLFELVANASVSLSGLTLRDGSLVGPGGSGGPAALAQGGAFFVGGGSTLALTNCVVRNNSAIGGSGISGIGPPANLGGDAYGGAIFSAGTLQIHASRFSNNSAQGGGGAMGFPGPGMGDGGGGGSAQGGAVYGGGQTEILDSQFSDNLAQGGTGGNAGPGGMFPGNGGSANGGVLALGNFAFVAFSSMANNQAAPGGPGLFGSIPGVAGTASGSDVYSSSTLLSRYTIFDSSQPAVAASCNVANMVVQGNNLDADSSCAGFTLHAANHFVLAADALGTVLQLPWGSTAIDAAADCKDPFGVPESVDLVGSPRPLDANADHVAACDLGAVEADYLFVNGFEATGP